MSLFLAILPRNMGQGTRARADTSWTRRVLSVRCERSDDCRKGFACRHSPKDRIADFEVLPKPGAVLRPSHVPLQKAKRLADLFTARVLIRAPGDGIA